MQCQEWPEGAVCLAPPRPALVRWLEERLREERRLVESRHAAVCEALRLELSGGGEQHHPTGGDGAPLAGQHHEHHQLTPTSQHGDWPAASSNAQESCATNPTASPSDKSAMTSSTTTKPKKRSSIRSDIDTTYKGSSMLKRFVLSSHFEVTFSVLIATNAIVMALEVQHQGLMVGEAYGSEDTFDDVKERGLPGWPNANRTFTILEFVFGALFTVEVLLKVSVFKQQFIKAFWNVFDSIIVGFWLVSSFGDAVQLPMNPMVFRVCRLVRLLRLIRLAKMSTMFDVLVLMISSVQASAAVLLWGIVLLTMFMTIGGFILNNLLEDAMDPKKSWLSDDVRGEIYRLFGTYTRCMLTMFEITMASWVTTCRLLVDNVGEVYAIFFMLYKCVVGFAVLKVITGVFLHETFRCASLDDDLMIQNRRRMRHKFREKMKAFYHEADGWNDGDGEVSCEEFVKMIKDDRVNTWLEAMDLRIRDIGAERIFAFLAGPDMSLTFNELCTGMSRLRGAAQGLDVVTLLEIASPGIQMPPSRDVLRLTGFADQASLQTPANPSVRAAAEMRQAAAELSAVTAELQSALRRGAKAGDRPLNMNGGEWDDIESFFTL